MDAVQIEMICIFFTSLKWKFIQVENHTSQAQHHSCSISKTGTRHRSLGSPPFSLLFFFFVRFHLLNAIWFKNGDRFLKLERKAHLKFSNRFRIFFFSGGILDEFKIESVRPLIFSYWPVNESSYFEINKQKQKRIRFVLFSSLTTAPKKKKEKNAR